MKKAIQLLAFTGAIAMSAMSSNASSNATDKTTYDFSFETLNGEPMPLSAYQGKVLMVVNTASKCGFTPQYKGLQALYEKYKDQGFVIIGVPSNDFGGQEPGSAQEIKTFCELNYGVTFPMAGKLVVSGSEAHPFYRWAKEVLGTLAAPKWNFHKYLIGRDGKLVDYYSSMTTPDSSKLDMAIKNLIYKQ